MTVIEKKAEEYAMENGSDNFQRSELYDAFMDGAEAQKKELYGFKIKDKLKTFNVLVYDFNKNKIESYDIIPYLIDRYKDYKTHKSNKKLETFEDYKKFIRDNAMNQFWGRCEWEIVIGSWPPGMCQSKIDVFEQINMNLDIVTYIFIENIKQI